MKLSLRHAADQERSFCESLHRRNMGTYLASRNVTWVPSRFLASWSEFENFMILAGTEVVGLIRFLPERDSLGLRDLQVVPEHQGCGIGSWAVQQAKSLASARGFTKLRLRVYEENPAKALYARVGFEVESMIGGKVQMVCELPPNRSFKPTAKPLRGSSAA